MLTKLSETIIESMVHKKHPILMSDGAVLWAGDPKKASEGGGDIYSYHYFDVYESLDDDKNIGTLGIFASGTVASMWGYEELDKTLCYVMEIALPSIKLPITKADIEDHAGGRYIGIGLVSFEQDPAFDKKNKRITITGYASPEEFVRNTLFDGNITDRKVKDFILKYANIERLKNEMGDGRFMSLNIASELFLPASTVSRCYHELVDDGFIEPLSKASLNGFSPFSKITAKGRKDIVVANEHPATQAVLTPIAPATQNDFISTELIEKLRSQNHNPLFTLKLVALLEELNSCYVSSRPYSCHALVRSVLDHIPPIFGATDFNSVADNYSWGRTDKAHMKSLKEFRVSADDALHKQIRKNDVLLELQGLPNHRTLNVLLNEALDLLEKMS